MTLRNIELKAIDPNPWRRFDLFPIDPAQVDRLLLSIEDSGFWGGMQVRPNPKVKDRYQLAFGHHRLDAARKKQNPAITKIAVEVLSLSDDQMLSHLVAENATQRHDSAAATLDAVANICARISYLILRYSWAECLDVCPDPPRWASDQASFDILKGLLISGRGIGSPVIQAYSRTLGERDVRSARQTLEASGEFGRIIAKQRQIVDAEIAEETRLKREAAEQAQRDAEARNTAAAKAAAAAKQRAAEAAKAAQEKAAAATEKAEAANKSVHLFDVNVASLFKNRYQLDAFRNAVTAGSMRSLVPVGEQMRLAQSIILAAKQAGKEPSAEFIRQHIGNVVLQGSQVNRDAARRARDESDAVKLKDAFNHLRFAVSEWGRGVNMVLDVAKRRAALPASLEQKFIEHVMTIERRAEEVADRMGIDLDGDGKVAKPAPNGKPTVLQIEGG